MIKMANYSENVNESPGLGDLFTLEEYLSSCRCGAFIDYDGFGNPVKDGKADPNMDIVPSRPQDIPEDATHIWWFNR